MSSEPTTEQGYRELADAARKRSQESFDRSDTDGCVSQWCSDWSAREYDAKADLMRDGRTATFVGLYEGARRVRAKIIHTEYMGHARSCWLLDDSERAIIARRGKKFLPDGKRSRVLKSLGLAERTERAPAWCKLDGSGRGISSLTTLYVRVFRTGCPWGSDAVPVEDT